MANNIRELRRDRGWSLRELADRMGAHFTTISKLESSQRKLTEDWRERFAKAFGVPSYEIIHPETHIPIERDWALPVIKLSLSKDWRDARTLADEWIGHPDSYNGSDWQFVIKIDHDTGQYDFPLGSFVFIDPEDRDLVEPYYYALQTNNESVKFGTFRNGPPRFTENDDPSASSVLMLGHSPFVTVGKVVGVYRRLSAVARAKLHDKNEC